MAIVITKRNNSKNIIVFNTMEAKFFDWMPKKLITLVKKKYYFFMHTNSYEVELPAVNFMDGYLAAKGTLHESIRFSKQVVHLSARNFLPLPPEIDISKKIWDLVIVANCVRYKNISRVKEIMNQATKNGKNLKILIVNTRPNLVLNKASWYSDLGVDFSSKNSYPHVVDIVTGLRPSKDELYPLSRDAIYTFMQLSKFTFLPSDTEGESRVIHESLNVGTPVVIFSHLLGGGTDYLTPNNSILLNWPLLDCSELLDGIANYEKFKIIRNDDFNPVISINKLVHSLNQLLRENFIVSDFESFDFSMGFAGHINEEGKKTITNYAGFYKYLLMIEKEKISKRHLFLFKTMDLKNYLNKLMGIIFHNALYYFKIFVGINNFKKIKKLCLN